MTSDRQEGEPDPGVRVGLRLKDLTEWAKLVGIFAIPLFAVLWFATRAFYGRLGVDPRDVGLDYASILAASSGQVFLLCLIAGLYVWLLRLRFQSSRWIKFQSSRWIKLGAAGILLLWWSLLIVIAVTRAHDVENGTVRPVSWLFVPIVPWNAWPAEIKAAGHPVLPYISAIEDNCVLYLGQADGVIVLYDVTDHVSLHLPSGSAILVVHATSDRTPACDGVQDAYVNRHSNIGRIVTSRRFVFLPHPIDHDGWPPSSLAEAVGGATTLCPGANHWAESPQSVSA